MSMAKDMEKNDKEYEQCVIALTTVMETAKVYIYTHTHILLYWLFIPTAMILILCYCIL